MFGHRTQRQRDVRALIVELATLPRRYFYGKNQNNRSLQMAVFAAASIETGGSCPPFFAL